MTCATSCALSHVTKDNNMEKLKYYTKPGHCTSTVLCVVAAIGNFEHGCKRLGWRVGQCGLCIGTATVDKTFSFN